MDAIDNLFNAIATPLGASASQLKLITCLLVSYPLGSVFIRIPSSQPAYKHLFNISITLFYLVPMLNMFWGLVQLSADVLVTWIVADRMKGQGTKMPWVVFWLMMGHLTINHIIRAVYDLGYETIEITGPQMVLVMKLTTFAWNVHDGQRPVEDLDKWQLEKRVTKFPSLIEFFGYAFYFPGILVGPYLEYNAYISLVDESLFKITQAEPTPSDDATERKHKRKVPKGRKRVAYRKGLYGLLYLGLFLVFWPKFNFGLAITDWFLEQNLIIRILFFQICGFFERVKYYGIWTLTEGASILTGLGFTGYDASGRSTWNGAANVNVWLIEFAPNFKVLLDSWNMKTNVWLRECVYKRVTPKGTKPGFKSSMITFGTSAFWHGIATGYYLTFAFGGFVQTAGRLCRASIRPLILPAVSPSSAPKISENSKTSPKPESITTKTNGTTNTTTTTTTTLQAKLTLPAPVSTTQTALKQIYDYLGILSSILLVNYTAAPFMLLSFSSSIECWRRLGWYGHWMIALCMTFFYSGGTKWLKGVQKKRVQSLEMAVEGSTTPAGLSRASSFDVLYMPPVDSAAREVEKRMPH